MAIKLFCDRCKEYMKDVAPDSAIKLSGNEICKKCKDYINEGIASFDAAAKKKRGEIDGFINKAIVELEEIKRRYLNE